jgi:hypothetical protein
VHDDSSAPPPPPGTPAARGRDDRVTLIRYLADREEPCPNCDYNLRGLTGGTCPECGLELMLRVGLVEPRLALWLAGLVPLAMTFGLGSLMLAVAVAYSAMRRGGPDGAFWPYFIGMSIVSGLALLIWMRGRSRFRRQTLPIRVGLVGFCWVLAAAAVLGSVIFIG